MALPTETTEITVSQDQLTVTIYTSDFAVLRRIKRVEGVYNPVEVRYVRESDKSDLYKLVINIDPLFTDASRAQILSLIQQAADLDADLSVVFEFNTPVPIVPYTGLTTEVRVVVTNDGPHAAAGVAVTVTLDAGLTAGQATVPEGDTYEQGVWTIGDLAADASATLVIPVTVNADQGGEVQTSTAVAETTTTDPDSPDLTAELTYTVNEAVNLSLTIAADDETPLQDQDVVFTITIANAGPDEATGIEALFAIPAGMGYKAKNVPAGVTYDELTGVLAVESIAALANVAPTVTLTVGPATTGDVPCPAAITAVDQVETDVSDDSDSVTLAVPVADLNVVLTSDIATVAQGGDVLFTVTVANAGPANASEITGTLPIPAGFVFKAKGVGVGQTYDENTGAWTIDAINNGANTNFTTTWTIGAAQEEDIEVVATITGSNEGDPVGDNVSSVVISVAEADLALALTVDDDTPQLGANVVLTLRVSNLGPDAASLITGTMPLPEKLTFVAKGVEAGETYDELTGNWTIDAIAANGNKQFTVTATVAADAGATEAVTGTITGSAQIDAEAANDSSVVTLTTHA